MWAVAARRQGIEANLDGAKAIQKRTRALLTALEHGPGTRTPSPPGAPPASISGDLAASVDARRDGDDAEVGPTGSAASSNGPYGRFLELGGTHVAHTPKGMRWRQDGRWHKARMLEKAPRPYLSRATRTAIDSGEILNIYARHWYEAQEEATG